MAQLLPFEECSNITHTVTRGPSMHVASMAVTSPKIHRQLVALPTPAPTISQVPHIRWLYYYLVADGWKSKAMNQI
jgi:hypothetical protein